MTLTVKAHDSPVMFAGVGGGGLHPTTCLGNSYVWEQLCGKSKEISSTSLWGHIKLHYLSNSFLAATLQDRCYYLYCLDMKTEPEKLKDGPKISDLERGRCGSQARFSHSTPLVMASLQNTMIGPCLYTVKLCTMVQIITYRHGRNFLHHEIVN